MVREQEELDEVSRAKLRLRAAAAPPAGATSKVLRLATGLLPQVFGIRCSRAAVRRSKTTGQGSRPSSLSLFLVAGAAAAILTTRLLRRRPAEKDKPHQLR